MSYDAMVKAESNLRLDSILKRQQRLAARLAKFSFEHSAPSLAGLLTIPENQPSGLRIETLITLCALCCRGKNKPTLAHLREWINETLLDDPIGNMEDPVEDVFVSNVPSSFGNARLFDGGWEANDAYTRATIGALAELKDRPWARHAFRKCMALLKLSEAVALRQGTSRYTLSEGNPRRRVRIVEPIVSKARAAVTFSANDLAEMRVDREDLTDFTINVKGIAWSGDQTIGHTALERHPLLEVSDSIVVIVPTAIGVAIRLLVAHTASAVGDIERLQTIVSAHQFGELIHLARAAWKIEVIEEPRLREDGVADFIGHFDEGSFVHVVLIPDALPEMLETGLHGVHVVEKSTERIISETMFRIRADASYRRGMTIVVHGGLGRGIFIAFSKVPDEWSLLALSHPDFMRLGWDHEISAQRVWKIIQQEEMAESRGYHVRNLNGFNNLYAYLRANGFVLIPEEIPPSLIILATNHVAGLRRELRRTLDQHVVKAANGNRWIEVQRQTTDNFFKETRHLPLFVSPEYATRGVLLSCVETRRRAWWISVPKSDDSAQVKEIVFQIWDMAQNWLVRAAEKMEGILSEDFRGNISFELAFDDIDDNAIAETDDVERVALEVRVKGNSAVIKCTQEYVQSFGAPKSPFGNGQCEMRRSSRPPIAMWIMAWETSIRAS